MVNLKDFNTFRPKNKLKKTGLDRERKKFLVLLDEYGLKSEYKIFGKFRGLKESNKFKHKVCGEVFEVKAIKLLEGIKCPFCAKRKMRKYQSLFKETIERFDCIEVGIGKLDKDSFLIATALIDDLRINLLFDGRLKFTDETNGLPFSEGGYSITDFNKDTLTKLILREKLILVNRHIEILNRSKLVK